MEAQLSVTPERFSEDPDTGLGGERAGTATGTGNTFLSEPYCGQAGVRSTVAVHAAPHRAPAVPVSPSGRGRWDIRPWALLHETGAHGSVRFSILGPLLVHDLTGQAITIGSVRLHTLLALLLL